MRHVGEETKEEEDFNSSEGVKEALKDKIARGDALLTPSSLSLSVVFFSD